MDQSIMINGKKYISASKASRIFGYASDYIGQLCRSKRLDSTRVGHVWFVAEEDVIKHKENSKSKKGKGRKSSSRPYNFKNKSATFDKNGKLEQLDGVKNDQDLNLKKDSKYYILGINQNNKNVFNFKYENDTSPLFPEIPDKNNFSTAGDLNILIDDGHSFLVNQLLKSTFITLIFVCFITFGFIFNKQISNIYQEISSNTANLSNTKFAEVLQLEKILNISRLTLERVRISFLRFILGKNLAVVIPANQILDNESVADMADQKINQQIDSSGVVVFPLGTNEENRLGLTKNIKDSFSDEVEIKVDKDGVSGTITPIFKETKGEDYMYVMVPLKE